MSSKYGMAPACFQLRPELLRRIGYYQHTPAARRRSPHRPKKRLSVFSLQEARRAGHTDHTDRIHP